MKSPLAANASQARLTKQRFSRPEEQLSYELGKAVQELPPLYTRLLAGTISLLVFSAIAWAHFSEVEEVAVAPGELIPSTQVRPLRAIGAGSIVSVKVKEGDTVKKGQVLIERDPSLPQVNVDSLAKQSELIQQDVRRLEAERTGNITAGTQLQDELLASRLREFKDRQATAASEANRQVALLDQARVRLAKLQENLSGAKTGLENAKTNLSNAIQQRDNAIKLRAELEKNLVLAKEREQSLAPLVASGSIPRLQYLQAQEAVNQAKANITRVIGEITGRTDDITNAENKVSEASDRVSSLEKDIAAQQQEIRQAQAAFAGAKNQVQRIASERQSEILTQLNKRREELTSVSGQLQQAKKQREFETIEAPYNGTVYSVKATKGAVQAGEELMSILPEGEQLLLEVKVLNRDIGFIREGYKAKVKMATFPFQEFGTVEGTVVQISPNAIADEKLGPVFPTRIRLSKHSLSVRGKEVKFTPGMVASGEIVTRSKTVLTFIIEPVTRRFSEAFSVR
ncbi:MAG: HlyD family efflux transporter periplasmic adaptor subunit [Nostocaceae cyanobacterium]|nr:HlyD family efflux transporter periplasmic adaptor subunit [Nostocaceae cyanobacterium]